MPDVKISGEPAFTREALARFLIEKIANSENIVLGFEKEGHDHRDYLLTLTREVLQVIDSPATALGGGRVVTRR